MADSVTETLGVFRAAVTATGATASSVLGEADTGPRCDRDRDTVS